MKNNFLKTGIKASSLSGKIVSSFFKKYNSFYLKNKNYRDLVSDVDILVEDKIKDVIRKNFPTHQFEGEETGIKKTNSKYKWIIDPIDGTVNFLHGIPHFAISIGLRSENEIISGLIFDPIKNEIFYAEKDNGAYFNNHRIRVSKKNKIDDCLFASGNKIKENIGLSMRKTGSAALDMAYVAAGRFDGFFQNNLNLWDIAAGIVLVKEAGGVLNEIDLTNHKDLNVIASSTDISVKLMEKLTNF